MDNNKSKNIILIVVSILIIIVIVGLIVFVLNDKKSNNQVKIYDDNEKEEVKIYEEENAEIEEVKVEERKKDPNVDIVNINSKSRPYMVVVNNTPVAVKVQEGLNRAYMVYEVPTEGNTSRLLAVYKDIEDDLVIGTIRSARHNFIDLAYESDAIFCCFGWSNICEAQLRKNIIDYLQGLWGYPFYRNNPEGLAMEHTAYTSMAKLKDAVNSKGFRTTTDTTPVLKYDTEDVDLSKSKSVRVANNVVVPCNGNIQFASFVYNPDTKMYIRCENAFKCTDHNTKEDVTTKNIIVQKITYGPTPAKYYWDLHLVGNGEGYFITNGYAVPITWEKTARETKTVYKYADGAIVEGKDVSGQEVAVSDGRTWIEIQTNEQQLTIE